MTDNIKQINISTQLYNLILNLKQDDETIEDVISKIIKEKYDLDLKLTSEQEEKYYSLIQKIEKNDESDFYTYTSIEDIINK